MSAQTEPTSPGAGLSLLAAAEVQDHLLVCCNDLERLLRLLSEAGEALMGHFHGANLELQGLNGALADPQLKASAATALQHLRSAVTALQFHDMSTQLISHTQARLRGCTDALASDALGDEDAADVKWPERPNPVTQDEMDAGSVELF